MPKIEMKGVVKSFEGFRALDGLDLSVEPGAVYGLVGPNGAGKTSAIRHLAGVLRQDEGEVLVDGEKVYENLAIKEKMVCVPDDVFWYSQDSTRDMMKFYRGIYPRFDEGLYERLGEVFSVDDAQPMRRLSRGMQKLSLIHI